MYNSSKNVKAMSRVIRDMAKESDIGPGEMFEEFINFVISYNAQHDMRHRFRVKNPRGKYKQFALLIDFMVDECEAMKQEGIYKDFLFDVYRKLTNQVIGFENSHLTRRSMKRLQKFSSDYIEDMICRTGSLVVNCPETVYDCMPFRVASLMYDCGYDPEKYLVIMATDSREICAKITFVHCLFYGLSALVKHKEQDVIIRDYGLTPNTRFFFRRILAPRSADEGTKFKD